MDYSRKCGRRFGWLLSLLLLTLFGSGCLRTYIEPVPIESTVQSLALANKSAIFVSAAPSDGPIIIGHQYLFLAVPFGRVMMRSPSDDIFNGAFARLAFLGLKPLAAPADSGRTPRLDLRLKHGQASAYDFVFIRWIKTQVLIEAVYTDRYGVVRKMLLTGGETSWKRFAFSKQLSFYFNRALNEALDSLPEVLGKENAFKRDRQ